MKKVMVYCSHFKLSVCYYAHDAGSKFSSIFKIPILAKCAEILSENE